MAEKKKFEIKRPTRTVSVCLDGDLTAEYELTKAKLADEQKASKSDARLNSPASQWEKKHAELFAAQQEQTLVFTLRGLPRHVWDELKTEHPVRKGNDLDEQFGFDTSEVFEKAMITDGTIDAVSQGGEPVEFTIKDWASISNDLTDGQWGDFVTALTALNEGSQAVPFSPAGYKKMQASAAKSK